MEDESSPSRVALAELRARSLGRSRSRGRTNPNELLARKQQILSEQENSDGRWRSQNRRSRLLAEESDGGQQEQRAPSSVEEKLESLSELLKNHQQQDNNNEQQETSNQQKSIENVYILLAKKEKDLQLAAELGKVLLEKNDELSKANERITEDYSHKLELLEQDKHKLKRKLDLVDGEYENRLIELQTDCNILKNQLDEQQKLVKQTEREKSKLIDDLVQQNQRLTSELVEATKSEELLSTQLEQMNERFNVRLSDRQDHVVQLDALKEEIQIVNQRKQDLERRLKLANNDKSKLSGALEESGDKILLLENLLNEKDGKLNELLDEINDLRDSSSWLSNELESMINLNERLASSEEQSSDSTSGQLELIGERKRSQLVEQLKELRLKKRSRLKASEIILINRRNNKAAAEALRLRDIGFTAARKNGDQNRSPFEEDFADELSASNGAKIYALLVQFQAALQARKESFNEGSAQNNAVQAPTNHQHLYSPNSTDDSGISGDSKYRGDHQNDSISPQNGQTNSNQSIKTVEKASNDEEHAVSDPNCWRQLLESLKTLIEEMPCSTCYLMIGERADFERLQKTHAKMCDELRLKNEQLLALESFKLEQETTLKALKEKCATLSDDLNNCDKPKEEIVKLAWKARDEAVERKNGAEISLAKARIENMQISSQLMEVVQQKGELSQKLAQFEDDIHYITQHSVKAKFTWEEYAEKLRCSKATQPDFSSSNPLAQLLTNFSVASSRSNATTTNGTTKTHSDNNNSASLMRNFTSNRFNLRFWQKSSANGITESQAPMNDKGVANLDNSSLNSQSSLKQQKAS